MADAVNVAPCPFCGDADAVRPAVAQDGIKWLAYYKCEACCATGPMAYEQETALVKWNRRRPRGRPEFFGDK